MRQKQRISFFRVRSMKLLVVLLIVSLTLPATAVPALAQVKPTLIVNDSVPDVLIRGGVDRFWVPVQLNPNGEPISSVAFALSYDTNCLEFDANTDSNNDGIPDSVTMNLGTTYFSYAVWHADVGGPNTQPEVVVVIDGKWVGGSLSTFPPAVSDITELRFDVKDTCGNADGIEVPVAFNFVSNNQPPRVPSFSDNRGNSVPGEVDNGVFNLIFNAQPQAVLLNGILPPADVNFAENQSTGTIVGTLTTDGVDVETYTYSFINCAANDGNNAAFYINGDKLRAKGPFDYEDAVVLGTDHLFKVCVQSTDPYGLFAVGEFIVNVTDVNEPPTDIQLANWHVDENSGSGATVGIFSTSDPDIGAGDTHTYSLVDTPTCSGPDFALFQFDDTVPAELEAGVDFDAEVMATYRLCVRSTDSANNTLDKAFTITVDDIDEAPTANEDPTVPLLLPNTGDPYLLDVLTNDTDPEDDDLIVFDTTPISPTGAGTLSLFGTPPTDIEFRPATGYSGLVEFAYRAKEYFPPLSVGLLSNYATVSFYVVDEDDRGDCNHDGFIDAADFSATTLEIFDPNNGEIDWRLIYLGDYAGSPVGCDSNGSLNGLDEQQRSVDAADLTCTVRLFFGEVCSTIMGADVPASTASLRTDFVMPTDNDGKVSVPVLLDTAGQQVAAVAFELAFDPATMSVDPTDANRDGIADAVTVYVPEGVAKAVTVDATAGRIKVALFGTVVPMPSLQDGTIVEVELSSIVNLADGQSAVSLAQVSIGNDLGQSLPVEAAGGVVTFGAAGHTHDVFLPVLLAQ